MNTGEKRAIEFEALVTDVQALSTEIQGMSWENEQRKVSGTSMAYGEDLFAIKAEEIRAISAKFRALK